MQLVFKWKYVVYFLALAGVLVLCDRAGNYLEGQRGNYSPRRDSTRSHEKDGIALERDIEIAKKEAEKYNSPTYPKYTGEYADGVYNWFIQDYEIPPQIEKLDPGTIEKTKADLKTKFTSGPILEAFNFTVELQLKYLIDQTIVHPEYLDSIDYIRYNKDEGYRNRIFNKLLEIGTQPKKK